MFFLTNLKLSFTKKKDKRIKAIKKRLKKKIISNNAKRTSFAYSEGKVYKKYIKLINSIKQNDDFNKHYKL